MLNSHQKNKPNKYFNRSEYMNKILISSMMVASLSLLTACGGGSSNSDFDPVIGGDPDPGTPVAGVSPIVAFSSSGSNSTTFDNGTRTSTVYLDSGFEGDIEARTIQQTNGGFSSFYQETVLAAGIPSMNVNDVQRTQAFEFLCDDNSDIRVTISTDYSSGEEEISGSFNGVSQSCSSTYQSILPTNISTEDSIADLIIGFGDEDNFNTTLISTNCPEDDTYNIPDPEVTLCNGKILTNVIVTDEFNFEHVFTHQIQFDYSD